MDNMKAHAVGAGDWSISGPLYFRGRTHLLTNLEYGLTQVPFWALWRKDGILVCSGNRAMIHGTSRSYLLTPCSGVLYLLT